MFVALAAALQLLILHALCSVLPAAWSSVRYWLQATWGVAAGAQLAVCIAFRRSGGSRRVIRRAAAPAAPSPTPSAHLPSLSPVPDLVDVSQPMAAAPGATLKSFPPIQHVFHAPFEVVLAALHSKYQLPSDPHHPYVRSVVVAHDASYVGDGFHVRHVTRVVTSSLDFVPALLRRWMGGGDVLTITEQLDERRHARVLHTRVVNSDMHSVGCFEQMGTYEVHPAQEGWTLFTARVRVATDSWIGRQMMAYTGEDARPLLEAHLAAMQDRVTALLQQQGQGADGGGGVELGGGVTAAVSARPAAAAAAAATTVI